MQQTALEQEIPNLKRTFSAAEVNISQQSYEHLCIQQAHFQACFTQGTKSSAYGQVNHYQALE